MAQNKFVFTGMDELKAELRALPSHLTAEAGREVVSAANGAAVTVRTIYGQHKVSGNLQAGVSVSHESAGTYGARSVVKSNAPHAWLFDNGSQARHYMTANGVKHATGRMWGRTPPTHAFVKTMIAARRGMFEKLRGVMERAGLVVRGEAA